MIRKIALALFTDWGNLTGKASHLMGLALMIIFLTGLAVYVGAALALRRVFL